MQIRSSRRTRCPAGCALCAQGCSCRGCTAQSFCRLSPALPCQGMLVLLKDDDSDNPLAQLRSASQGSAVPGWLPGCPRARASHRDQARSRLPYRPPAPARRPSPPWLLAWLMRGLGSDGGEAHIVAAHCGRAAGESKDFLAWSKSFPSPPCCGGWGRAAPAGLCAGNRRLPLHGGSRDGAGILPTPPSGAKILSHQLCSTTCMKSLLQEEILGTGLVWGGLTALHRVAPLGKSPRWEG